MVRHVPLFAILAAGCARQVEVPSPAIDAFTASSQRLPYGGGRVSLAWVVRGAAAVAVDPGVGAEGAVQVAHTTRFTLTASNESGKATKSVIVFVEPERALPEIN